jgi:hypothetical protein
MDVFMIVFFVISESKELTIEENGEVARPEEERTTHVAESKSLQEQLKVRNKGRTVSSLCSVWKLLKPAQVFRNWNFVTVGD